jgi:hypothetical protein
MPGMVSTRWLTSFERCCILIRFSIDPISVRMASSCAASTMTLARASIGNRVVFVRHDREQFRAPRVALRRNDAELGQVRSESVDALGALTYQQIARAVLHQLALLLGRLDPHKAHRRSSNRLADRLGVSGIVLVAPA